MSTSHPFTGRKTRSPRGTNPRLWGRNNPMRLEELEDRSIPSVNLPLNGFNFTELGPRPIAAQRPDEDTSSPGKLATSGRLAGIATHPVNPDIVYIAAAGGGVAKTTDGGITWTEQTDRIPGLTDIQRNLNMGSIAISPVQNPTGEYNVYAGQGELVFSGDAYTGKGILKSSDGGKNWSLIEGPGQAFVDIGMPKIVVVPNPDDPTQEIVYAVASGSRIGALGEDGITTFASASTVYGSPKPNAVWRSKDGGASWAKITGELNTFNQVSTAAAITDFAVDPDNPETAYVAVGDPGGFPTNNGLRSYLLNGVYRTSNSLDATPDWTVVFGGSGTQIPGSKLGRIEIALAPSRPSTVFTVAHDINTDGLFGVYRSLESGINFRKVTNVPDFLPRQGSYNLDILVDPSDENKLYLAGITVGPEGLVGATDAATAGDINQVNLNFSNLGLDAQGEGPHADSHALALDAAGRLLVGGDGGLFRADLLAAGGGKLTPEWVSMNGKPGPDALNVVTFVGIGLHPQSAEEMFGGTQDNGLNRFFDPGAGNPTQFGWSNKNPLAGDSGNFIYDFINPQIMFNTSVGGAAGGNARVTKSIDGGKTWTAATTGIATIGKGGFYAPLEMDPGNSQRLFFGEDNVYVTKDSGANWAAVAGKQLPYVTGVNPPDDGRHPVTAIGVGRSDGNVIYAAVGERWQNINGVWFFFGPALYQINLNINPPPPEFPSWVDISPGVTDVRIPPIQGAPMNPFPNFLDGPITDIAVDPFDANIVYITVDGPGGERIWRSNEGVWNFGDAPPVWTDITGSGAGALPDRRLYSVAIDNNILRGPVDDDIYVGTEIGIYKWTNPTTPTPNWVRVGEDVFGKGLPDVRVMDVEINTTTGILAAGTYGRGVWQLQIRPFISGFEFEDKNANGIRDFIDLDGDKTYDLGEQFTEPGLPGLRVITTNLNTPNNAEQANTITLDDPNDLTGMDGNDGYWEFRSLPDEPGVIDRYRIRPNLDGNQQKTFQLTTPPLGNDKSTGDPFYNDVTRFTTLTFQNIGLFRRTFIEGVKFDDINGNGKRDPFDTNGDGVVSSGELEPGIPGFTLELLTLDAAGQPQPVLDAAGKPVTVVSGPGGVYRFDNLGVIQVPDTQNPGRFAVVPYFVREVPQANFVRTTPQPGDRLGPITLTSGTPSLGNDFGNFRLFSLVGVKFHDINGNAVRDPFDANGDGTVAPGELEPGLPDWEIRLFDSLGNPIRDTQNQPIAFLTGPDGKYRFDNLVPRYDAQGNVLAYRVREVLQAGWAQVTADPVDVPVQSGQVLPGGDFGNFRLVSIEGSVTEDANGNGRIDAGEVTPVGGGFAVLVDPATGNEVGRIGIDAAGSYKFGNIPAAKSANGQLITTYTVRIEPAAGFVQTTPSPAPFTLSSGKSVTGLAFGVFETVTINGVLFEDLDGDGFQDPNEPLGLGAGQTATLDLINSGTGLPITGTTQSIGPDGRFSITNLGPIIAAPGQSVPYRIRVTAPAGFVITAPNAGNPPDADGETNNITLQSGVSVGPIGFGGFELTRIAGTVFNDLNGDGVRQANETGGVLKATVTLFDTRTGQPIPGLVTTTDKNGAYSFTGLGPLLANNINAPYRVQVAAPAGFVITGDTSTEVQLKSGTPVTGKDFAGFQLIAVSGKAFNDLNGNGAFDKGEPALPGWEIRLANTKTGEVKTATTDKTGAYAFGNLGPGVYQLRETVMPGFIQTTPNPADVTATSGVNVANQLFGNFRRVDVGGRVVEDLNRNGTFEANEPGLAGFVVNLFDKTGTQIDSRTTGAGGVYAFAGLPPGTYSVRVVLPPSYIRTNPDPAAVTPTSGQNFPAQDFGVLRLGSVQSFVFSDNNRNRRQDAREPRLANVQVFLRDATDTVVRTAVSNANGEFTFLDLEPGNYTIQFLFGPAGSGFVFSNPDFPFGFPFTVTPGTGTAGNDLRLGLGIASTPTTIAAADKGGGPHVQVFDALTAARKSSFFAFEDTFTGGVRVGRGDLTGDGVEDYVAVRGPGGVPEVRAFDGVSGALLFSFLAYENTFTGGMFVAVGDVNQDGIADIVTGTDIGGGPRVQVFDGKTRASILNYFAYEESFRGGVRVAAGDVNGDGAVDIVTTPAEGGGPRVTAFDGRTLAVLGNFFAFDPADRAGVYVAAADFTGDDIAEIVVGQGATENPLVRIFTTSGAQLASAQAFPPDEFGNTFKSEVRVSTTDRFGDGKQDVVITSGPGSLTRLRFLDANLVPTADELRPYEENFTGGVYVG